MKSRSTQVLLLALALPCILCACERTNKQHSPSSRLNDEIVVLLNAGYAGSWPTGLDPATNTTAKANLSQMNAIFGGLFQLLAKNDGYDITGVLAQGYRLEDEGRSIIITLRDGVVFSDGSPFDATAVKFSIERSLSSPCTCAPTGWPWRKANPVTAPDNRTVVLHFSRPYPAAMNSFPVSNVNWIISPASLKTMGEAKFRVAPVGAGPFRVVSDQLSSKLVLERNPRYWDTGHPYLHRLIFQSIGSEQAGYLALLARSAQVYEGMTSTSIIEQARGNNDLVATPEPATSPYVVQLNTSLPPFNDQRAREAVYFATDVDSILTGLFQNSYSATQTFTGPGGLFHHQRIVGYKTYNLSEARRLVREVGGVKVRLATLKSQVAEQVMIALQSQWSDAGMDVSIESYELASLIDKFGSGQWQAMLQTVGSYDPEAGAGVRLRFGSGQRYSGVNDVELDRFIESAGAARTFESRDHYYLLAAEHISDNAYAPFLFAFAPTQISVKGLAGPGLTTAIPPLAVNTSIVWQDVRYLTD